MRDANRFYNATNPAQGKYKRVLTVCSAGLLRSPTAAFVLSQEPFNFNTRAVGMTREFALIPYDHVLGEWSDEAVVMESGMVDKLRKEGYTKPIHCLDIEDDYEYRDPKLMAAIAERYSTVSGFRKDKKDA